jgi:hypothetical protein
MWKPPYRSRYDVLIVILAPIILAIVGILVGVILWLAGLILSLIPSGPK